MMLKADGYEVVTAQSGKEALERLRRQHFEVALTDLVMPEMDGIQTLAALRDLDPDIQVIVVTGYASVESAVTAIEQGACDYLLKPLDMAQLRSALSRALERRRLNTTLSLYEASRTLLATLDRRDLIPAVLDLAQRAADASAAGLARVSPDGTGLHVDLSKTDGPLTEAAVKSSAQQALQTHETLREPFFMAGHSQGPEAGIPAGSVLAYPLEVRNALRGALVLWRDKGVAPFTVSELRRGKILAAEIAIALDHSHLYRELSRKVEELERAHGEAARAEAHARAIVETAQEAIILLDQEGVVRDFNPKAAEIFGWSREQAVGRDLADFAVPPRLLDVFRKHLEAAYRVGKDPIDKSLEVYALRQNGEEFPLEVWTTVIETPQGKRLSTFARDITARKRTEQQTRLQTAALQSAANGIVIADREGRILWVNPAFTHLTGYPGEEVVGQTMRVLKSGEQDANFYQNLWQTILSGRVWQGELVNRRKDGTLYTDETTLTPVRDATGSISHFIAIKQDITERKRAERALEERTAYVNTLIEISPLGIVVLDTEQRIQMSNPALEKLFLYSRQEMQEANLDELIVPRELVSEAEGFTRQCLSGASVHALSRRRRKDGTLVDVEIYGVPLVMDGEPRGLLALYQDITERKQAEQALAQERDLLGTLMDNLPDYIYFKDRQSRFLRTNRAHAKAFGFSDPGQAIGKTDFDFFAAEHAQEAYHDEQEVITTGKPMMAKEEKETWPDGRVTWVSTIKMPFRDAQGAIIGTFGVSRDITESKRAEADLLRYAQDLESAKAAQEEHAEELARLVEELAHERDLLRTLMDNLPDYIYFKDHQSRFVRTNRAHAKAFGLSDPALVVGKTDFDFFTAEHAQPAYDDEQEVIRTGNPMMAKEEKETWPDGRVTWVSTTKMPFRDLNGAIVGTFGVSRDITERKRAEEALRTSEERYRELFENASDLVYTADLDLRLTSLNRVAEQTLGYVREEAVQMNLRQLVDPRHWQRVEQSLERLLAGESAVQLKVEVTAKDGRRVMLEMSPRLICKDGKPVGVQGIARDITGRDVVEMELRHAQKLESVGRLASGIAHEINTPIQFVGDNTRFLQDSFAALQTLLSKYQELRDTAASGTVSPDLLAEVRRVEEKSDCAYLLEEIPKALTQTLDGVTRVATIVRAMKDFAHPESKEMAAADLNKALQSTLTVARNELKYVADVEIDLGDLPSVVCNIGDLNQVFLNLLVNAAHAIDEVVKGTGKKGKIRVRTVAEGKTVLVTIADTGGGIPEGIRTKIFDPFFTTKEVGRGTGQGLAIARSVVVERHGGTLTFESEVGKGTTFYVRLPFEPGASREETKLP